MGHGAGRRARQGRWTHCGTAAGRAWAGSRRHGRTSRGGAGSRRRTPSIIIGQGAGEAESETRPGAGDVEHLRRRGGKGRRTRNRDRSPGPWGRAWTRRTPGSRTWHWAWPGPTYPSEGAGGTPRTAARGSTQREGLLRPRNGTGATAGFGWEENKRGGIPRTDPWSRHWPWSRSCGPPWSPIYLRPIVETAVAGGEEGAVRILWRRTPALRRAGSRGSAWWREDVRPPWLWGVSITPEETRDSLWGRGVGGTQGTWTSWPSLSLDRSHISIIPIVPQEKEGGLQRGRKCWGKWWAQRPRPVISQEQEGGI